MIRRLAAALATAHALLACEVLLGLDEVTVAPGGTDASSTPPPATSTPVVDAAPMNDVAVVVDAPDGARGKHVFVTSTKSNGILGGRGGADAQCATAAANGKLAGVWIAWLSEGGDTTPNAVDRIPHDGPFLRLDDVPIAQNKAQLTSGTLLAPIILTEKREVLASPSEEESRVWTGTFPNGAFSDDCQKWSSSNFATYGTIGWLTQTTNGRWTDNGGPGPGFPNWGCQTIARLYCFEL